MPRPGISWLLLALTLAVSCSKTEATPRVIRAHTTQFQDISHAEPAKLAGRHCSYCHGVALQGGSRLEPSCFTCHGINWLDATTAKSTAPADHTISNQGFLHKPGLFQPNQNCASCHGADLSGSVTSSVGVAGCYLCHESLWLQRTPSPGS